VAVLPSALTNSSAAAPSVGGAECRAGAGYPDEDYEKAGAVLLEDHGAIFEKAEMIVKVKEPLESEYDLLRPGQILFTYLHLAASRSLTEALLRSRSPAWLMRPWR